MKKRFIVLASGGGSNFLSLINAVNNHYIHAELSALVVDRKCGASELAKQHDIDCFELYRKNKNINNASVLLTICEQVDLVVCAGFLSIIPPYFIERFKGKIINIHPALLPKYGGENMYGMNVHKAVIASNEKKSGCSVHYVDKGIDTGEIIGQAEVMVTIDDNPENLQKKVLAKEHQLLPLIVKQLLDESL